MATHRHPAPRPRHQGGAALIVTLLMLVVVLLLAVSAAVMSGMDERMARNTRDQNTALQAAETALREARLLIEQRISGSTGASATCDGTDQKAFCLPAKTGQQIWERYLTIATPDTGRTLALGETTGLGNTAPLPLPPSTTPGGVAAQPRYLIEVVPDTAGQSLRAPSGRWVYRITAVGWGALPGTQLVLQELYRPRSGT